MLLLLDAHLWTALAAMAIAGLVAVPEELRHKHLWLQIGVPMALAGIGIAAKAVHQHADAVEKCD